MLSENYRFDAVHLKNKNNLNKESFKSHLLLSKRQ